MTDMEIRGISVLSRMDGVFWVDPIIENPSLLLLRMKLIFFVLLSSVPPATFLSSRNVVRSCVDLQTEEMTIRVKTRGTSY